jgi:hypothetical protein
MRGRYEPAQENGAAVHCRISQTYDTPGGFASRPPIRITQMYEIDATRIPRDEDDLWEILHYQFDFVLHVLWHMPVQTREDALSGVAPGFSVIRYRGTSPEFDNRDKFLRKARTRILAERLEGRSARSRHEAARNEGLAGPVQSSPKPRIPTRLARTVRRLRYRPSDRDRNLRRPEVGSNRRRPGRIHQSSGGHPMRRLIHKRGNKGATYFVRFSSADGPKSCAIHDAVEGFGSRTAGPF